MRSDLSGERFHELFLFRASLSRCHVGNRMPVVLSISHGTTHPFCH